MEPRRLSYPSRVHFLPERLISWSPPLLRRTVSRHVPCFRMSWVAAAIPLAGTRADEAPPTWIFFVTWLRSSGWQPSWRAWQEHLWRRHTCRNRAHSYNRHSNGAVGLREGETT